MVLQLGGGNWKHFCCFSLEHAYGCMCSLIVNTSSRKMKKPQEGSRCPFTQFCFDSAIETFYMLVGFT